MLSVASTTRSMHSAGELAVQNKAVRVMVVDDEKMLAWTMGRLLTKAGYQVVTLSNPLMVLDELRTSPVDLVISDVVMPEMSGIDLAIELKQRGVAAQIILLSGQANTLQLMVKAQGLGYDFEVFPKPIAPRELLRLVEARVGIISSQAHAG